MAIFHITTKTYKAHTGRAVRHHDYIMRQGTYSDREDLVNFEIKNMPSWAKEYPARFWDAADSLERANGRAAREIELALPRELTRNQQIELARQYARELLGKRHAYEIAVHDKGDGNPHVHLFFSERQLDGVARERSLYFKRANSKHPERGGCAKDDGWRGTRRNPPERLLEARTKWADQLNAHLERAGVLARVDHRSLKAQGITREVQIHVGPKNKARKDVHADRMARNEEIKLANDLVTQERAISAEFNRVQKELDAVTASLLQMGKMIPTTQIDTNLARLLEGKDQIHELVKSYTTLIEKYGPIKAKEMCSLAGVQIRILQKVRDEIAKVLVRKLSKEKVLTR
jgi:hypothetical protein